VVEGQLPTAATDQWLLGALVAHLLLGEPLLSGEPGRPGDGRGDIDPWLRRIQTVAPAAARALAKMLAVDPRDRYGSEGALIKDLLAALRGCHEPPRRDHLARRLHVGRGQQAPARISPPEPTVGPAPTPAEPPAPAADDAPSGPLRDPFCPLVNSPSAGAAAIVCVSQNRHQVATESMKLLDVFLDRGVPHARVQVAAKTGVLHVHESSGGFQVESLDDRCGEFSRAGQTRTLCEGDEWGAPSP
jgi:hypothetical protein